MVKVGDHLKSVPTNESMVIYSQDKGSWVWTADEKIFLLDFTMDQIEDMLDPEQFFRISRKFIVNLFADASGQKSKTFQQSFDIWIKSSFREKVS